MNVTENTINWSELTPAMRDGVVAAYIMHNKAGDYTQDMSAAWQVVERFDDAIVSVTHVNRTYHHCRIKPFDEQQRAHHGTRMQAPEAICIAALRTIGINIIHAEEDILTHQQLDR